MKTWVVAYKDKDFVGDVAVVKAPTYTMALVEFMIKYPNCDFTAILEVMGNESVG